MLFNSYIFLFAFLPITLAGYQVAAHIHRHAVMLWLTLASLVFYAYWSPRYLLVLGASVLFNYIGGALISRRIPNAIPTRAVLIAAIAVNLGALCYFKYFFPLLHVLAPTLQVHDVVLPLGISFFTFTQIAYLIDLQQGDAAQQDLGSYALFATFFPHLIAGPILHHAEIMPQFQQQRDYRLRLDDLSLGFTWFLLGLAKKVLIADRFAPTADAAFASPAHLGASAALAGVLSYTLQLYFDFSGYSDMAVGLARMFSIDFPLNFNSPYKASSIIDFWQRWHITLTRYINTYLYNPLALWVSRRRAARRKPISRKAMATPSGFLSMVAFPTLIALFLAGVWHGAGLQFVIFGLLHALYLIVNHAWRVFRGGGTQTPTPLKHGASVLLTLSAVILAQIFFRAADTRSALAMLAGVAGLHRGSAPASVAEFLPIAAGFAFVWLLPNTQEILGQAKPTFAPRLIWKPTLAWGVALGLVLFAVLVKMQNPTTFLYFQF